MKTNKSFSYLSGTGRIICYVTAKDKLDATVKILESKMIKKGKCKLLQIDKIPDPIPILK